MSLALTSMRGAFLNCRFAENGIQKALRSFGATFNLLDITKPSFSSVPETPLPRRDGQRLVFGAQSCYANFDRMDKR
jgi:hypothetical protein